MFLTEEGWVAMEVAKANNHYWLVLASVSMGTVLSVLNGSIVSVALPTMAQEFNTGLRVIQWVVLAYLLTITAMLPVVGRIADILGRKPVYCSGFLVIMGGAVASALAGKFWLLIAARVIMAIGAAMPMATGIAIITAVFPAAERGRAMGMVGSLVAVGLLLGPVMGGFLVSWGGWQWVFWVNIPLGLASFFTAWYLLHPDKPESKQEPFDCFGAALFVTGIIALLLVVSFFQDWGLTSPVTLLTGAATIILLISFGLVETRTNYPLVDFGLFKIRSFIVGISSAFLFYLAMAAISILTPFYLQELLGYPPSKVGLFMFPLPLVMSIVALLSGYLSERMSPAILTTGGLLFSAIGLGWLALIQPEQGSEVLLSCFGLVGFGMGLFLSPNNSCVMGSVSSAKLGLANGLNSLTRNLGNVIGTAIMVGVFTAVKSSYLAQGSGGVEVESAAFLAGWRVALLLAAGLTVIGAIVSMLHNISGNQGNLAGSTQYYQTD
jgi:EmrB/QacA subfamily drug resistance transporter